MSLPSYVQPLEYIIVGLGIGYEVCQLFSSQAWISCFVTGICLPLLWWLYHLEITFTIHFKHLTRLRPHASPGLWCTVLVPLCLLLSCHGNKFNCSATYTNSGLTSATLLLSTVLWLHSNRNVGVLMNNTFKMILQQFIPLALSAALLYVCSGASLLNSMVASAILSCTFNFCLSNLLNLAARSFTLGEAIIVSHSISVFCTTTFLTWSNHLLNSISVDKLKDMTLVCQVAIMGTLVFALALVKRPCWRSVRMFYGIAVGIAAFFIFPALCLLLGRNPVLWFLNLIGEGQTRVILMLYWVVTTAIAIMVAVKDQFIGNRPKNVVRKYFHILIIAVYVPGLFLDSHLLYLASGIVLGIFVIIECVRVCCVPPLGKHIDVAYAAFLDEKDQGQLILTHFYLLIGCSLPLWMIPELPKINEGIRSGVHLASFSGLLAVGFGDTVASIGGTYAGKHRWPGIKKTVEGTVLSVITQIGTCWLLGLTGLMVFPRWTHTYLVGIFLSAFLEAFTFQIDNLVLPLFLYIVLVN